MWTYQVLASAVLYAVGRQERKTFGAAIAVTIGTRSTREESVLGAFESGIRHNVYPAIAGRHTRTGMLVERNANSLPSISTL